MHGHIPGSRSTFFKAFKHSSLRCCFGNGLQHKYTYIHVHNILYSQKYWQELNLAVGSQIIVTANILADLNLAVRYGIAICIISEQEILADFLIWQSLKQTTKLPNLIPHQTFHVYSRCMATLQYMHSSLYTLYLMIPEIPVTFLKNSNSLL